MCVMNDQHKTELSCSYNQQKIESLYFRSLMLETTRNEYLSIYLSDNVQNPKIGYYAQFVSD